jgi:NitT/TauT family transport system substrate-binding protein
MRQISRRLSRFLASLLAGAAMSASMAGLSAAGAETIMIGVGIDPGYTAFYTAKQEKLFEKAGLDVKLVQFAQGGEALDAVVAKQVAVTGAAEPTTMIRMGRSDVVALGSVAESGRYLKLVARAGVTDPNGIKTFGVVPGGAMEYLTGITMKKYGMDPASVKQVRAGPPEMPALLARGDIDAFWLFEPFPTMVASQGGKLLANSGDVGYVYNFWVSTTESWMSGHKDDAEKILKALAGACDIINADPQRGADATLAEVRIPAAQTLAFLKQVDCKMRDFTADDFKSYDAIAAFLSAAKITPTLVDYRKAVKSGFYKP